MLTHGGSLRDFSPSFWIVPTRGKVTCESDEIEPTSGGNQTHMGKFRINKNVSLYGMDLW